MSKRSLPRSQTTKPTASLSGQQMACRVCKVPTITDTEGTVYHAQSWREYDHDPEPVLANYGDQLLLCDFCAVEPPIVVFHGNHVVTELEQLGNKFSACPICDTLIRRGRIDALVERHFTVKSYNRNVSAFERRSGEVVTEEHRQKLNDYQERIIRKFAKTIKSREPIPPPPKPPPRILPTRMPRVRDRLAEFWKSYAAQFVLNSDSHGLNFVGEDANSEQFSVKMRSTPEVAERLTKRMVFSTEAAELYWISPSFTNFAVTLGKELPDITITRSEMPAPHGFVVFGAPVHNFLWGPEKIDVDIVAASWALVPGGVWMVEYIQPEQTLTTLANLFSDTEPRVADVTPEYVREKFGFLIPLGPGCGVPFGADVRPETSNESYSVWSALFSTWALMEDPKLADVTEEKAESSYARSYKRRHQRAPGSVRCVNMRKTPRRERKQPEGEPAEEAGARVITKRSMVGWKTGGYWNHYWYGLGRTQRKRVWIKTHARGPEDAPWSHEVQPEPQVVKVLR